MPVREARGADCGAELDEVCDRGPAVLTEPAVGAVVAAASARACTSEKKWSVSVTKGEYEKGETDQS